MAKLQRYPSSELKWLDGGVFRSQVESLERWGLGPKSEWDDVEGINSPQSTRSALALKCALLFHPIPGAGSHEYDAPEIPVRLGKFFHAKESPRIL